MCSDKGLFILCTDNENQTDPNLLLVFTSENKTDQFLGVSMASDGERFIVSQIDYINITRSERVKRSLLLRVHH